MTQLYHRPLLSNFDEEEIVALMTQAIAWLESQRASIPEDIIAALILRLRFREMFFEAVAVDVDVLQNGSTEGWQQCTAMLPLLLTSQTVGKPVKEAFSVKIQRKLASTVPPRPIVTVSFNDAIQHLRRLCQDGKDVVQSFQYFGSNDMLVSR